MKSLPIAHISIDFMTTKMLEKLISQLEATILKA
jgi:hypothetical protein